MRLVKSVSSTAGEEIRMDAQPNIELPRLAQPLGFKRIRKLDRLRLCGPNGARDKLVLTTSQNDPLLTFLRDLQIP